MGWREVPRRGLRAGLPLSLTEVYGGGIQRGVSTMRLSYRLIVIGLFLITLSGLAFIGTGAGQLLAP